MKQVCLFITLLLSAICTYANNTVEEVWKNMPDSIIPYLNSGIRAEMADLYKEGNTTETKNILEGKSCISKMTSKFADIKLTTKTRLQIQIYDCSDSTQIVCLIKTYCIPAAESEIAFYKTNWEKIDNSNIELPNFYDSKLLKDILIDKNEALKSGKYLNLENALEPFTVTAEIKEGEIILSPTILLQTKEEQDSDKHIFLQKSFKWDGKTFK